MARDEEFARWYRTYHPRIRALCARMLRDPIAAEDIAQEALLRAWTHHAEMREADLGAWLAVVARNLCVSTMRRDRRMVPTEELTDWADPAEDPARAAGRRETRHHVRQALAKLGDRHRRVIYLREIGEADYEEIGSELGLTAEGARSIAFRARRTLREKLVAAGEGFSAVLLGIRIQLRKIRMRTRDTFRTAEAGAMSALQSGLNAVVALAIAITGGFAVHPPAAVHASPSLSTSAVVPGAQVKTMLPELTTLASTTPTNPAGKVISTEPLIDRPDVTTKPWGKDQTSEFCLKQGATTVCFQRGPTEKDGLGDVRSGVDDAANVLCRSPEACALIRGGDQ